MRDVLIAERWGIHAHLHLPYRALYVFSLHCDGHHRYLHSFPTRRSSDLFFCSIATAGESPSIASTSGFSMRSRNRSEEHTSELQSRLHLVCRLLLEKKKNPPQLKRSSTT